MTSELLSIITLTHNKREVTEKCLTSLLATTTGMSWELVVVDNGSVDDTRDWLATFVETAGSSGISVRLVLNDGNIGCSTARNQGVAEARGEKLVFIDNDVALRTPSWLNDLSAAMDLLPDAVAVGPKLVYPYEPFNIQCAGVGISRSGRVFFRGRGESRTLPEWNHREEVQCLISACYMMRRTAFEAVGGFDEAFNPVEFEDFDLVYKMREAGGRAYYIPEVEMYHFESVTTQGTAALPNTYLIVKNGLLFKKRWRHMFENEDGPPDDLCRWRTIEGRRFADIGDLPSLTAEGGR